MKYIALILVSLACAQSLRADATAYQALNYLGEHQGPKVLEHIYIVKGEGGDPQPKEWILFRGRANSSIFRTTAVHSDGRIVASTSPVPEEDLPPHSLPLNFTVLNLDTNAAWNIAKRQARKENFRFNRADYQLTTHPIAHVPAWTMRLFNEDRGTMGVIVLSGATGEVLNSLKLYRYKVEDADGYARLVTTREPWGYRALRSVGRWFSRTGEAYGHDLLRAAGTAEEILIDQRTRDVADDVR